ncbi:uncharacterized protein [Physcomitrium patens]|uniref:uncharacterized protein isoform X1 n=1 Tax=Physcomitrium patens TaxID=3218 RepID=UPI003CCD3581
MMDADGASEISASEGRTGCRTNRRTTLWICCWCSSSALRTNQQVILLGQRLGQLCNFPFRPGNDDRLAKHFDSPRLLMTMRIYCSHTTRMWRLYGPGRQLLVGVGNGERALL